MLCWYRYNIDIILICFDEKICFSYFSSFKFDIDSVKRKLGTNLNKYPDMEIVADPRKLVPSRILAWQ